MNLKKAKHLRKIVRAEMEGSKTKWFNGYTEDTSQRTNSKTFMRVISSVINLSNANEILKDFRITLPLVLSQPSGKATYRQYKKLSCK